MTKVSRNAPCPCGSGKKYKKCCLPNSVNHKPKLPLENDGIFVEDKIDSLSNSVIDLINEKKLDKAEEISCQLLREYPDQVDGLEKLAMVCKAKGDKAKELECHCQVVEFMKTHPGFDADSIVWHQDEIKRLEAEQNG